MVYKSFDKKSSGSGVKSIIMPNQELAEELHKPIIRKFEKQKVYSSCKDKNQGAGLVYMQLISKFNKGFRFVLCFIDVYSKYAWVLSLKDKESIAVTNAVQKQLNESKYKLSKIWVDKKSKFYNR